MTVTLSRVCCGWRTCDVRGETDCHLTRADIVTVETRGILLLIMSVIFSLKVVRACESIFFKYSQIMISSKQTNLTLRVPRPFFDSDAAF